METVEVLLLLVIFGLAQVVHYLSQVRDLRRKQVS